MFFVCVILRESAPTAAKTRTNLSSHRRSCRKPLDRSGPNLIHVCRFIWEWTSAKQINPSSPKGYLEGVRGSHIQKCGKYAKHLDRSGPNLAHVCIFIWEWTYAKNTLIPEGHGEVRGVINSQISERFQTASTIGTSFGARRWPIQIHQGIDIG